MYTQCPDCATVFRVTAEALRAAQGDVRCGVCSTTFDALENLSEQPFRPGPVTGESTSPDDSMTVEELPGSENIELSSPVELSVVADAPPGEAEPSGSEEDRALEFHGDDADLDRLFVVERPEIADSDPTDEHPILVLNQEDAEVESIVLESPEPPAAPEPVAARPAEPPETWTKPPPGEPRAPAHAPSHASPSTRAPLASTQTAPRILIPDEMRRRLAEEAAQREEAARAFETVIGSEAPELRRPPWGLGVATLALLLGLQVVHGERDDLARSRVLGPVIAGAYSLFGLSLLSPIDLAAYELRSWGAASDPGEAGRLLLRASIVNRARFAQPLPLLRLVLQDRFGGTLGARDVGPADYLPGAGGQGLLGPGERADAVIRIVDPGTDAVGFELDVCLPAGAGVRCASQVTTARQ